MEKHDEELIRSLLDHDEELRRHYQEHQVYERQLEELRRKHHLTADEEVEQKRVQKLKLAGMDRIMEIIRRHR
jgi:hypothetical protein